MLNDLAGGIGQAEVQHGGDDQGLAHAVGGALHGVHHGHDVLHADGVADGGLLDDGDELVGDGGEDILDGLGQHHEAHALDLVQSQGPGGLRLAAVNGLDAGADDLGEVGTGVQGQGHHGREEPVKADEAEQLVARQDLDVCKDHIEDQEDLDHHRRGPEQLHIHCGQEAQGIESAELQQESAVPQAAVLGQAQRPEGIDVGKPHDCQQQCQDKAENNGEGGQGYSADNALQEHGPVCQGLFKTGSSEHMMISILPL